MKQNAPKFKVLINELELIGNSRLRSLFGTKLHEIDLDQATLQSIINMLAHADDRVNQLEKLSLPEWVDIAKCQTWVSYAPLLKKYGTVGYFFVFLNSLGHSEGEHLRSIVDKVTEDGAVMIFEKLISRITYMVAYKELEFSNRTSEEITTLLKTASMIASSDLILNKESFSSLAQCGYAQRFGNIYLLVNESFQLAWMLQIMKLSVWNQVFPQNDRSLSDVVRLTVNPQDDEEHRTKRKIVMEDIQKVLGSTTIKDPHVAMLKSIDDVIYQKRKIHLRDTQKVAVLCAMKNQKNLLSQVNTGEGKSLIIVALAIMRIKTANDAETVDIITSSSVLAQRDAEHMRDI
ncbi:unnamed protein product, partial [Strongylus vulgaris]